MKIASIVSCFVHVGVSRVFFRGHNTVSPRVRFAPSPTGLLHLGGLRTALYNYLFAKSHNGSMILRIEDTDQTRRVEGAMEALEKSLHWAYVRCSEGPAHGGDYGPYVQSERLDIYREHVNKLLGNGAAYHCFCTRRRLDLLRRDAMRLRQVPRYDNRCRSLTKDEVKNKLEMGTEYCIRFKLTSECLSYEDLIFGGISYDVTLNEGDPVIIKGDGFPTYHFANVVDDHLMRITHVLRGVEWQISTTKHILIYRAFGWEPPQFGHLPLIVNADGTKLSKRQNDVTVDDYRSKGILPLALVNYITLSGGGFDHMPGEGVRIQTLEELAQEFRIERVSSHPSRLNPELLTECNRLEIARQLVRDDTSNGLVQELQRLVRQTFPKAQLEVSDEYVSEVLRWAKSRITRIEDLVSSEFAYLWILPEAGHTVDEDSRLLLGRLSEELKVTEMFDETCLKESLRAFATREGVQYVSLMRVLRTVLSGLREGPGVAEMMQVLGKRVALQRIAKAAAVHT